MARFTRQFARLFSELGGDVLRMFQTSAATTEIPPAGERQLYPRSAGWYDMDSAGVETRLAFLTEFYRLGRVLTVDDVYGDDSTAAVGQNPYKTIEAALADATSGDTIWVMPGLYSVSAGITIPDGVIVRSFAFQNTIIQKLAVTADTTLVTMGDGCVLFDIGLKLTSAEHHTLKGIVFSGTTNATSRCNNVNVLVDNSSAGAGASDVHGVHISATSVSAHTNECLRLCRITTSSAGTGKKRALLADGNGGHSSSIGTNFKCTGAGGADYIGIETNHANATFTACNGHAEGTNADVAQTLGTLELKTTRLVTNTCNGLNFVALDAPGLITFGDAGALPGGVIRYFYPGTETVSGNEAQLRIPGARIIKNLSVKARVGPGAARTDTFTVRKNGVNTALTTSLTGAATTALDSTNAVSFAVGDLLSVQTNLSAGSTLADLMIILETY